MIGLQGAVRARNWELVWLHLLVAVVEKSRRLPPGALAELLDLLGGDEHHGPGEGRHDGA